MSAKRIVSLSGQVTLAVSLEACHQAVVSMHRVNDLVSDLAVTKRASGNIISAVVKQNGRKDDGSLMAQKELCNFLMIPCTKYRLEAMIKLIDTGMDWQGAYNAIKDEPMTKTNVTAAYGAVSMALTRMRREDEKATTDAENSRLEAEQISINTKAKEFLAKVAGTDLPESVESAGLEAASNAIFAGKSFDEIDALTIAAVNTAKQAIKDAENRAATIKAEAEELADLRANKLLMQAEIDALKADISAKNAEIDALKATASKGKKAVKETV